jgi:hypothetical protein
VIASTLPIADRQIDVDRVLCFIKILNLCNEGAEPGNESCWSHNPTALSRTHGQIPMPRTECP